MLAHFEPRLDILPERQRLLWPELDAVPPGFVLYGGTGLALQFYGDGTLDRVPAPMQRDLTRWAQAVDLNRLPSMKPWPGLVPEGATS